MKKICLVLLAAVLTLLCVGACADSYHFADIYMILDVREVPIPPSDA